jgi:hypothetical protein
MDIGDCADAIFVGGWLANSADPVADLQDTTMVMGLIPTKETEHVLELALIRARRTAFVARFIVLRESKRSRSHRVIEALSWHDTTSAEELCEQFLDIFRKNGDSLTPVKRDLDRAMAHASRSLNHFVEEYTSRATLSFVDALFDYEKSNSLLFGDEDEQRQGGWRLPRDLARELSRKS